MFLSEYTDENVNMYNTGDQQDVVLSSKLQLYVDFYHDYNVAKYVLAVDTFKFRRTM